MKKLRLSSKKTVKRSIVNYTKMLFKKMPGMARCDLTLLNFLPILGAIFSQMRQHLSTYSLLKLNMMQGVVNLCECQRNF